MGSSKVKEMKMTIRMYNGKSGFQTVDKSGIISGPTNPNQSGYTLIGGEQETK